MKNILFIILLVFSFNTLKSQEQKPTVDSMQIAGLCKVWGLIKYYHPDVTKKKIDWDNVLIENYPDFKSNNDFESYNRKLIDLIDTLSQAKHAKKVNEDLFSKIVHNEIESLDNFKFLSDTTRYINRISFSWINDDLFSKETKYKLCEILVNYKVYESKFLKGSVRVRHVENKFEELDSITEPHRILALFRYWNTINYFSPYKHLSDHNWDTVLREAIPKMISTNTFLEYVWQLQSLSSKINDSHGVYECFNRKYFKKSKAENKSKPLRRGFVPYSFRLIDNQVIVSDVLVDSAVLNRGDTILRINNTDLKRYRDSYYKYYSHSTKQSAIHRWEVKLSCYYDSKFTFHVLKNKDTISLTEPKVIDQQLKFEYKFEHRKPPFYSSINDKAGYIDLTQVKFGKFKKALRAFKNKEAVVFDLRGYPETMVCFALAHLLGNEKKGVAAYYYPNKKYPGTFINKKNPEYYRFGFVKPFILFQKPYLGKAIVLIDASVMSQSETFGMIFKAYAEDVIFIGTPTAGADGDISTIYLPGGISFNFSSLDWHYPDGSQLQRIGIIPNVLVKETAEDLITGKDIILERAVQYIENDFN